MSAPGQARNQLSGTAVGSVVQARSIHGGVHFHAGPEARLAVPLPRQLPPRPAYFTDRSGPLTAIAEAAAAAAAGSLVIVVIVGAGGTGKTAVAVHALHEAAALFPGGQLYAALGGFSPGGPVPPPVVTARWLRALGMHPPADPAEATALFRSLTTDRPVAILADDADDAGQARALLPGTGLVVVTSRYQMSSLIAQDGARLIRLGPLEAPAAAELAGQIIARPGTGQDDLAGLARCCGHLPLAIRAAAARLAVRPHLSIRQVTGELAAAQSRLHVLNTPSQEVIAAMQTSYDDLGPETARAYRLLATCPGPDFTQQAAAALLDTAASTAATLIGTLAGASLLEETAPGRWQYHDLTGEHARQLAVSTDTPAERAAAIARVTDYYLRGSAAADLLILPGRMRIAAAFALPAGTPPAHASEQDALAWCDTEQASLLAVQQAAASLGLHTLAWQFADTLWGWCSHRHDYPAWEQVCQQAITSAQACGDARAEVFAATRLASCYIAAGDITAAKPVAEAAITTAWASGDRAGEGSAREHVGLCALAQGDYPAAISHATRGLECWRNITAHPRAGAILERLLGQAHAGLGDYRQATAHLDTALAVFAGLGEEYHTARTLYVIAITRLASTPGSEHADEAITLLQRARRLLEAQDHPLSLSELLTALADAHARAGNTGPARDFLDQAAALHQRLNLPGSHPARARAAAIAGQLADDQEHQRGGASPEGEAQA